MKIDLRRNGMRSRGIIRAIRAMALVGLVGIGVGIGPMGCGGRMPEKFDHPAGRFTACPESPNCVSSFARDEGHGIDALEIDGPAAEAWEALEVELAARSRVEIVHRDEGYLHAVFTTRLMRYRDDVEFQLDTQSGEIQVRSASRVGRSDLGANRARIESIRAALAERGVVRSASDDASSH